MRWFCSVFLTFGVLQSVAAAQDTQTSNNIIGKTVVLRALDKVTATTEDFSVSIGDSLEYGSLLIDVKHCEKKPPEEIPQTWAFVQVFDSRMDPEMAEKELEEGDTKLIIDADGNKREKIFSGWMLAQRPAISALEHPVYDVWVIDCKASNSKLR